MSLRNNKTNIKRDPFIIGLLKRIPREVSGTFTEEQLLSLKIALGARQWGVHPIDIRGTVGFWLWRYYYVFLVGKARRVLSGKEQRVLRMAEAAFIFFFLTGSALFGLLILYILKSALGIDLIPGHSTGLWGWFKENVAQ